MLQSHHTYLDQAFHGLRLDGQQLREATFTDCRFQDCSFREAALQSCRFSSCQFRGCDLSLASLPGCVLGGVTFTDCKLVGLDWTRLDWQAIRLGGALAFERCALNHGTFLGLVLESLVLRDCQAVNVDFRECNLRGGDLSGTDFSEALFLHTDLRAADLRRARNYTLAPHENTLTGARFALPEALALLYNLDIELDGGGEQPG
jgi:uncharacterized protein YjbI with pentapeptide repeats